MKTRATSLAATSIAVAGIAAASVAVAPSVLTRATSVGRIHPVGSSRLRPADAALVLGARVWEGGRPSLFLRQRVEVGVALYRSGLVSRLIMSGAASNREGLDETEVMARVAEEMGVPFDAVEEDGEGVNTYASARRAVSVAGVRSVIVASQEFHLPRALWLCRQVGLDAQGAYPPVLLREHTLTGYAREVPATAKAVLDVWSRRIPDSTV